MLKGKPENVEEARKQQYINCDESTKEYLLWATRLSQMRPLAFRPRFTTGLAITDNKLCMKKT